EVDPRIVMYIAALLCLRTDVVYAESGGPQPAVAYAPPIIFAEIVPSDSIVPLDVTVAGGIGERDTATPLPHPSRDENVRAKEQHVSSPPPATAENRERIAPHPGVEVNSGLVDLRRKLSFGTGSLPVFVSANPADHILPPDEDPPVRLNPEAPGPF